MNGDKLPLDEFIKKFSDTCPLSIPKIPRNIMPIEWNKYLTSKRIALIGPAEDTKHVLRGRWLKQFDAIARCNRSIPIEPHLFQFIGNKTDIYYNNLHQDDGKNIIVPQILEHANVKIVVGSYPPDNTGNYHRFVIKKESGRLPYRTISISDYNEVMNRVLYRPTTGILAIYDLLKTECDFLFICGFSFFSTLHIETYKENTINYSKNIHNMENEKDFIRHLAYQDSRLILDKYIRDILWKEERSMFYQYLAPKDETIIFPTDWDPFHSLWIFNPASHQITLFDTKINNVIWSFIPSRYIPKEFSNTKESWFPYWWFGFSQIFLNMYLLHPNIFSPIDRYIPILWKSLGDIQCDVSLHHIPIWDFLRANQISLWIKRIEDCLKIEERRYFFAESPS